VAATKMMIERTEQTLGLKPVRLAADTAYGTGEDARDHARALMGTPEFDKSRDERKKLEMRFAHLKTQHRFERMRLRGLSGARDEFLPQIISGGRCGTNPPPALPDRSPHKGHQRTHAAQQTAPGSIATVAVASPCG
jgi:hypothetical protein